MRRLLLLVAAGVVGACGVFGGEDPSPASPAAADGGGPADGAGNSPVGQLPADFAFTIDPLTTPATLVQGASVKLKITVKRGKLLTGPIEITTRDLPGGITSAPLALTGDSGELELSAQATAAQGAAKGTIEGRAGAAVSTTPVDVLVRGKPGDLDTTFGVGGEVLDLFGVDNIPIPEALVLAPDDSLYLVAACAGSGDQACVVHVSAEGKLDNAYGTGGIAYLACTRPVGAALQPDGKLVVLGLTAIGRLDAAGQPDITFGSGSPGPGTATLGTGGLNGNFDGAVAVALRSDGDIYVAWDNTDNVGTKDGAMRLAPNGSLRTEFGLAGTSRSAVGYTTAIAVRNNPASLSKGNLVMTFVGDGTASSVLGFNQKNGNTSVVDPQFGPAPKVITVAGARRPLNRAPGLVELADESIITTFEATGGMFLRKFTSVGDPAVGFGTGGMAGPFTHDTNGGSSLAVQADGKILVALLGGGGNKAMRFTAAGALDTTFANSGRLVRALPGGDGTSRSVVVQKSGRIVLGGRFFPGEGGGVLTAFWP
jgi:uncharacterized delta-60 repeat protein